ncbi:MAG: hypothetical protein HYU37_21305 [Acidobacteria bacterium]|nr:hypothetical protein [Acidobacteriota bacterium]
MRRLHPCLRAVVLATLLVHTGAVLLGSLRACWADGHTHAGGAAECPMHTRPEREGARAAHHGHHGHAADAADTARRTEQITCRCTDDLMAPDAGAVAVVTLPASMATSLDVRFMAVAGERSPRQIRPSPLFPPPRLPFSATV